MIKIGHPAINQWLLTDCPCLSTRLYTPRLFWNNNCGLQFFLFFSFFILVLDFELIYRFLSRSPTIIMPRLAKVIGSLRRRGRSSETSDHAESPKASVAADDPDAITPAPLDSASSVRTRTGSSTFTPSASCTERGSTRSSRRTSEELRQNPEIILSNAQSSTLVREFTGFEGQAGEALHDHKALAMAGISLCCLAGYSRAKTMKLLSSMPEYGVEGNRLPNNLNIENLHRGLQQRREEIHLRFTDFDGVDPLQHRLKADEIMYRIFGDDPDQYKDDVVMRELDHWLDTWTDEVNIFTQHGETARAAEIEAALEPYVANLGFALSRVTEDRERRLRRSSNLERFHSESSQRRAEIAGNKYAVRGSAYKDPQAVIAAAGKQAGLKTSAGDAAGMDKCAFRRPALLACG